MRYIFIAHAKQRMKERSISERLVEQALDSPTKILYDNKGRLLIKKLYKKKGQDRLLLIVAEPKDDLLDIITVIDTSKIKKYL